jgi:phosphoenolpyruvate carboxykinase (ATP)
VKAALSGELNLCEWREDDVFGFAVPLAVADVDTMLLNPRQAWGDVSTYNAAARNLLALFEDNAKKFADVETRRVAAE